MAFPYNAWCSSHVHAFTPITCFTRPPLPPRTSFPHLPEWQHLPDLKSWLVHLVEHSTFDLSGSLDLRVPEYKLHIGCRAYLKEKKKFFFRWLGVQGPWRGFVNGYVQSRGSSRATGPYPEDPEFHRRPEPTLWASAGKNPSLLC